MRRIDVLGHSGLGGSNQLVFDDSPSGNRIELSSTTQATRLQLGSLLQQQDNQRLAPRGHGLELATAAHGALRAGSGLLLSAHAQSESTQGGQQLEAQAPQQVLQTAQSLVHTLAESAQAHNARLVPEPAVAGATAKETARQLPVEQGLYALQDSLRGSDSAGSSSKADEGVQGLGNDGGAVPIEGGFGTVAAWNRPDLVLAAPAGIGLFTPVASILSAGAMPAEFAKIAELTGAGAAVPEHKVLEMEEELSLKGVKPYGILSFGMGVLRLFALRQSIVELGVELGELRSGELNWQRLARSVAEVAAPALGVWQATYEVSYVLEQITAKGAKSAEYFRMVRAAGRLTMAVSIVEGLLNVLEARTLWNDGDKGAAIAKAGGAVTGVLGGAAYYAYTRMIANAGMRVAAAVVSHGEAAEVAAGMAAAAEAGAVGTEVSVEVPPVAMWLGIASAGLLATSWILDFWSSHMVTSPLQKWADRSLVGLHSSQWGKPFKSTKQQLDTLLRIYYSVKLEKASLFSSNAMEVKTPVFSHSSELVVDVRAPKTKAFIGRFELKAARFPTSKNEMDVENVLKTPAGSHVHAQAKREEEGISLSIWIGSANSAESNERENRWLIVISPLGGAGVAAFNGLASAEVRYWPDRATYPDFVVDGRSTDEASEGAEPEKPEKRESRPEGEHAPG